MSKIFQKFLRSAAPNVGVEVKNFLEILQKNFVKKFAENFVGFLTKIYIENVNVIFIRIYYTYNNISIYLYIYRAVR